VTRHLVLPALALAALASPAHASKSQQSIFMDDPKVVYSAPDKLEPTLREMKRLGADRIRVSVFWSLLAPQPTSTERPFGEGGGADPRNYAAEKWDRYDRIVTTAESLGLKLLFNITGPSPHWATGTPPDPPPRPDIKDSFRPSATEFRDFVKAVGTRYSGSFNDEAASQGASTLFDDCLPTPNIPLPPAVCPPEGNEPPEVPNPPNTGPVLPRVGAWSIWNEPNMPGWLTPQWHESSSQLPASPHIYRALADGMYTGLVESGHGEDTILLAETAPNGARERTVTQSIRPLLFIRELYCVDRKFRPFTGAAAQDRGCPHGGAGFAAEHPVLFSATGFAHHPYAFLTPPGVSDKVRDHAVLADIGRLMRTLDRAFRQNGSSRRIPVWLTEYGYQTDPPDPYSGWSWRKQRGFLAEAEWLAYKRPRIKSTAQFLLYDDQPLRQYPERDPRHWGTFQTGLRTANGKKKSAWRGYQRTIHVRRRGDRVIVFGLYRPATGRTRAQIQFKHAGRKSWRAVRKASTNAAGFLRVWLERRRPGRYRVLFATGNGRAATRSVSR
jgi:hypothetical protein